MTGRVFAVVGPSGAGKDTLLGGLAAAGLAHRVRRVITRPPRPGDEPFDGVSEGEFARHLAAGAFVLHWRAHGLAYGLPRAGFQPAGRGRDVVFNGSRALLADAARVFPGLRVILVEAPPELRAARIATRGREAGGDIAARLARETGELPPGLPVIRVLNDGTPEQGIARLIAALRPDDMRAAR
ncbi:phosphonate metabolism protein/1,5-bisphosphokinase (PRPP-forming) PhnN [Rhodovulum tesquicola]|uniref:phosphonate metabolism protein/1,5-bisphosphokinase (PRPP-forming) PhnN n=1 Tax=Rhodovulum tesquicola TaxID=540254 RepID=UPI0020979A67|nr:phosphonate metabolism protein/1,5-bisphosphokinase (PRPP-forming) PhnN [Rhodovulum tesquicola]MCO8146076.1 phosphonate metabolism protein/1,5-bisphosphokinase (PRPP-forming) PhnN [Rhodovulum tesquicola]